MTSIFPDDVRDAADKMGGEWIKPSEFESGLTLQFSKPLEKVVARNPKYGGQETDYLVKNDILEKGETFEFTFLSEDGTERKLHSKSAPFFIAFKQVEELGVGDWVTITRTGKTDETRYTVEKIEHGEVKAKPAPKAPTKPKYDSDAADEMTGSVPF